MIGLILRIKGIEKVDCSFDFYVERDRALHFEKGDLLFAYDNGPEYYACIDTDIVGRGALKCRAVILDGVREVVVSGYTGFTIPCMGEGTTISCRGYSIEFSEAENLPQGGDVPDVDWPDGSNLNDYITDGVYSIRGVRKKGDNVPILNEGVIAARLTVLTTDDNGGNKVVTQVLTLNNNAGGEGNVYVRSSQEGHWKPWGKLQTNIEVGQVTTLDNLVDNGIYSGVLTDGSPTAVGSFYDTFVLIVLNNYSVAGPLGVSQSISQLKYSLKLDATIEVAKRKRDEFGNWTEWESVGGGPAAIEAQAPLAQKDGKLTLNIGDGLRVENEKLVAVPQTSGGNALRALFVAAGAEYNDTGVDIVKTTPWADYVDNQDILNVSASDVKTIVQGGTTYKYVIDNGVYKVILTDLLGNIRHNEQYCVHRAGHYYLNGLGDITEKQMLEIYNHGNTLTIKYFLHTRKFRTNRTLTSINTTTELDGYYYARDCELEVINFDKGEYSIVSTKNPDNVFGNMFKVIHILGRFRFESAVSNGFYNCKLLKTVKIHQLKYNLSLSDCPLISKKSILYVINNSVATTAITITLHPNAYGRMNGEPEIEAALSSKPFITLVSA
ncbi:MAG: hypothetical protein IKV17_07810 [Bacteroidaceae bacterium]|nr:hypothetical protein [Bacteroidaceae bacterium]